MSLRRWALAVLIVAGVAVGCGPMSGGGGGIDPKLASIDQGKTFVRMAARVPGEAWDQDMAMATVSDDDPQLFHIALANSGSKAGRIRVREGSRTAEWSTQYFDSPSGGADITAAVRGSGWYSPTLGPGEHVEIGLIMHTTTISLNNTGTARVRGYADNTDEVAARVTSNTVPMVEPDIYLSLRDGTWTKNLKTQVREGQEIIVDVSVTNIGLQNGNIVVRALGDTTGWSVTAYQGATSQQNI